MLPVFGSELVDIFARMVGYPLHDIHQICVRVDAVHFASDDEALEDADILGAHFGPAKEPVLSAYDEGPDAVFCQVIVNL